MTQIKTENLDLGDLICGLKTAVTALECQHNMEMQKKILSTRKEQQKPLMIPVEGKKSHSSNEDKEKCLTKNETKEKVKTKKKSKKTLKEEEDECAFISPEMRGGVLYNKCDCIVRNGLQDDCPLTLCQGQPDCLSKPWPECPPGKYFRNRYFNIKKPCEWDEPPCPPPVCCPVAPQENNPSCCNPMKACKSCELRSSTMWRCNCIKRNGLQDRCMLIDCLGRPECMTKLYPVCEPGKSALLKLTDLGDAEVALKKFYCADKARESALAAYCRLKCGSSCPAPPPYSPSSSGPPPSYPPSSYLPPSYPSNPGHPPPPYPSNPSHPPPSYPSNPNHPPSSYPSNPSHPPSFYQSNPSHPPPSYPSNPNYSPGSFPPSRQLSPYPASSTPLPSNLTPPCFQSPKPQTQSCPQQQKFIMGGSSPSPPACVTCMSH